jgi:hypothetical protein
MKRTALKLLCLTLLGFVHPLGAEAGAYDAFYSTQMFTTNTLFIEAEDADFGAAQFVTTTNIGMNGPYPGGSYLGLGTAADLGIDWNATSTIGPQSYRPNTSVKADNEKGSAGNDRGTFHVLDWWTLGWNDVGNWYNYTRVFPSTAQNYIVLGHLASGGNGIIELDQITAGVGQPDASQVKTPVGFFTSDRITGWESLELFPLTDINSNLITVSFTGTNTLRATILRGSDQDLDYFAFIPATAPLVSAEAVTRDEIRASIVDIPAPAPITVDTATISLTLNGAPIAGSATKVSGITSVVIPVSPFMARGSTNTLVASFIDTNGKSYSFTFPLVVTTFITKQTKFIEGEDTDFGAAQFLTTTNIGMDGPYPGGSYSDLGTYADLDIDWHGTTGIGGQTYRPDILANAGKEKGSAGNDRGYFRVVDWWTLGWNYVGDWENYTRQFPATNQWYEVYGHLSSGGFPIEIRFDQVTAGVGQPTADQVLKPLGYFAPGRATAGWDSLEIFPLLNVPGGVPTVVNLNSITTLRFTHLGDEDVDYYAFVPVTIPAATIAINTQPQSQTVVQGNVAQLTVAATTTGAYGITYQWSKNGSPITGGSSSVYITGLLDLPDSGSSFTVTLSSPGAPDVTSSAAVVTVENDTTPPVVVSAGSIKNQLAGMEVGVIFNKPLTMSSAASAANYTLDNGATVSLAAWVTNSSGFINILPDGTRVPDRQQGVVLSVSALDPATSYKLTVNNVSDYLGNTINSVTVPVVQSPFTWVSLGVTTTNSANPNGVTNEVLTVGPNSWNLVNGGIAFWGTEDDITMVYEAVTNDFDKTEQVEWHDPSSNFAGSGICAREDTNPANAIGPTAVRYQSVLSNPETKFDGSAANGAYLTNYRLNEGDPTTASNAGGSPHYTNSYVRLKRVGQNISMFYSATTNQPQWWRPLGTTSFDPNVNSASLTPLTDILFVGPMLGVENGNIINPGIATDPNGAFVTRIRNYGDMPNKPRGNATYAVGLNFGGNEAGAQLSPGDIAGVDVIAQGNWNNLFGNTPTGVNGIVAEKNGAPVLTSMIIDSTGSPNTWSSQGPRGDEAGALLTGNDAVMMTGYLDTGSPTTTYVTNSLIPADLTAPGYDVIVYAQGGVGARGGAFRITDPAGNVLADYVKAQSVGPENNGALTPGDPIGFVQVIPNPNAYAVGNFLVFTNLHAFTIVVEATTDFGFAFGATPRAPINGIQLVTPSGLIKATVPRPVIKAVQQGNNLIISWTPAGGTLQSTSALVNGGSTWTTVGTANPATVPVGAADSYFRVSIP